MQFILTAGWDDGIADLTERLVKELADGQRVLWLVSGGSNIPASVKIMNNISLDHSKRLTIMLADERYGPVGHADSNLAQLMKAGFSAKSAHIIPTLVEGLSLQETANTYDEQMRAALSDSTVVIAQLGIGEDGHIAGILPKSPAASSTDAFVVGYHTDEFDRITMTFEALRKVTAAYVFAFGEGKKQALVNLQAGKLSLTSQPSQILNQLTATYLYNDQVGVH